MRGEQNLGTAISTTPRVHPRDYFTRRDPRIAAVAHRGGLHPGVPANSLAALQRAAHLGFRYVEIDLRATTDGRLVLWHGIGLERLRPDQLLDVEELDGRSVSDAIGPVDLVTAVESLPRDMCYFLDLKNTAAADLLGEVARATQADYRFCVGSFSGSRTESAAKAVEEATGSTPRRTITPSEFIELGLDAYLGLHITAADRRSAQIPTWAAKRRIIDAAHKHDIVVIVWTVNQAVEMRRLLDRGADGLMSDNLQLLKRVLEKRRRWTW